MDKHGLSNSDLIELANDPVFQEIFASDPLLDQLESEAYDEQKEFFALNWFLGLAPVRVGTLPLHPLTPGRWAFLWAINNGYACSEKVTALDADVFLFIMAKDLRDLGCEVPEIPKKAAGMAAAAGLTFEQAHEEIKYLISVAFLPLQLLPKTRKDDKGVHPRYDVEWLADLVSVVAAESGEPARYILHEMPLTAACAYVISARKAVDLKHEIGRRPSDKIAEEIMERSYELGQEYLSEKRNKK